MEGCAESPVVPVVVVVVAVPVVGSGRPVVQRPSSSPVEVTAVVPAGPAGAPAQAQASRTTRKDPRTREV